jgi:hypothetical protein
MVHTSPVHRVRSLNLVSTGSGSDCERLCKGEKY